ncbi:hypothetical protein GCM10017784_28580 [Deinococcus indicus]|nr:hypothetical protein GCM10017784_28580 [Deinococcus indicus]
MALMALSRLGKAATVSVTLSWAWALPSSRAAAMVRAVRFMGDLQGREESGRLGRTGQGVRCAAEQREWPAEGGGAQRGRWGWNAGVCPSREGKKEERRRWP